MSLNEVCWDIKPQYLKSCVDPMHGIQRIFFHLDVPLTTNKASDVPALMQQLTLDLINNFSENCLEIYRDDSKDESRSCWKWSFH